MESVKNYYDDEIDLYAFVLKLWAYKFFIGIITVLSTLAVFFAVKFSPDLYTSSAEIIIGEVSAVSISRPDIEKLNLENFLSENERKWLEEVKSSGNCSDDKPGKFKLTGRKYDNMRLGINVAYTSSCPYFSFIFAERMSSSVISRHFAVYKKAISEIEKNLLTGGGVLGIAKPEFFIETYNFSSYIHKKPYLPKKPDSKKLLLKTLVALAGGFFIAASIILFRGHLSAEKNIRRRLGGENA